MKNINTLIKDVYDVAAREQWFDHDVAAQYSTEMGAALLERLTREDQSPRLRLSQMGEQCPRSLWASIHAPSLREKLTGQTRFKFHYGDVIELLALTLAKAAGHSVKGEQDECELLGIRGHRDCVLDGHIVDVKSVNSMSFQRIASKQVASDPFLRVYLDQLDGYAVASLDDPLVINNDVAYIWAIDKVIGRMTLYEHRVRPDRIRQRVTEYKAIVASNEPPGCTCGTMRHGESGNIRLDTKASYNPYKRFCFPHLRTFYYKDGKDGKLIDLVKIVKMPNVPELDKNGNFMVH